MKNWLLCFLLLALTGCATQQSTQQSTQQPTQQPSQQPSQKAAGSTPVESAQPAAASTAATPTPAAKPSELDRLIGPQWRLVVIQSMDDNAFRPQAEQVLSLQFIDETKVVVQADCNKGSGSWELQSPSGMTFGPIALTRMMCGDNLSQRFLSNLKYVRSFVLRDGRLYLATMADGAILEFERTAATSEKVGSAAVTPSFECQGVTFKARQLVCGDAELAALDVQLDKLYQKALALFSGESFSGESWSGDDLDNLKTTQKAWLKERDDCWKATDVEGCVRDSYDTRITELQISTGSVEVPSPVNYDCADGSLLSAYFYNNTLLPALVLNYGAEQQALLYASTSASGSKYEGRNVGLWTKGDEATVTLFDKSTSCRVK